MAEKSVEVVEGLVVRAPPGGRRTYSIAAKRALVHSCLRPGVSVASTALANGINANLLRRWMVQYGPGGKSASAPGTDVSLVPVSTTPTATLRVPPSPNPSSPFTEQTARAGSARSRTQLI
jgi:transposase-like protein